MICCGPADPAADVAGLCRDGHSLRRRSVGSRVLDVLSEVADGAARVGASSCNDKFLGTFLVCRSSRVAYPIPVCPRSKGVQRSSFLGQGEIPTQQQPTLLAATPGGFVTSLEALA
jgi:hypothetical protein